MMLVLRALKTQPLHVVTASGRRQLEGEIPEYRRMANAIGLLLDEA